MKCIVLGGIWMTQNIFAEWTPLLFMAFALGMDAFSVSLGLGMQMLRLKRLAVAGIVVGFFHTVMPLLGVILRKGISTQIGALTMFAGVLLSFGFRSQVICTSFHPEGQTFLHPVGFGLFLLALTVSIASLSVGLSLGLFAAQTVLVLFLCGFMSMVLAWAGLLLVKKTHHLLCTY